jgi:hypothetical protein
MLPSGQASRSEPNVEVLLPDKPRVPQLPVLVWFRELYLEAAEERWYRLVNLQETDVLADALALSVFANGNRRFRLTHGTASSSKLEHIAFHILQLLIRALQPSLWYEAVHVEAILWIEYLWSFVNDPC